MGLAEIMTVIGATLEGIDGLHVYDYPSDSVQTPAAVLDIPETDYDRVVGETYVFSLWLFIARANDRAAAKEILQYIDPTANNAIVTILEADKTLGGQCDTLAVTEARPQIATVGAVAFLAVEYKVEVYT